MSKGTSAGVNYYGYGSHDDKGKAHPRMGPGQNTVKKISGGPPAIKRDDGPAVSHLPAGVQRDSGTETRKGTSVSHQHTKTPAQKTGAHTSVPGGVVRGDGRSAPKRVR